MMRLGIVIIIIITLIIIVVVVIFVGIPFFHIFAILSFYASVKMDNLPLLMLCQSLHCFEASLTIKETYTLRI